MTELLERRALPPADVEALIEEARRRARRRRTRRLAIAVALAALGGAVYGIGRALDIGGGSTATEPGRPVVDVRAFSGSGRLAFVSHGTLWALDGSSGTLRPASTKGSHPRRPAFSPDGRWLAYLQRARLWIAHADGSGAHAVPGPAVETLVGWSPRADLVAVTTGPERTRPPCPCHAPTELRVVAPNGTARVVARAPWIDGASWSPDGRALAVAAIGSRDSRLVAYRVQDGGAQVWLVRTVHQRLNGMTSPLFAVAGWWPRAGIGIWVYGDGAVRNLDGTALDAVAAPGAPPRLVGTTLSDGVTDAVAAGPNGDVAVVVDTGGGRAAWQGKQVELCSAAACRALPHARGDVTVDPVWSADGRSLFYAEAPNVTTGPWTQGRIRAWFDAHRLLRLDAVTHRARPVPGGAGATAVTVSPDGESLVYVRDDALWLLRLRGGRPVRIAGPLFAARRWPQYYGQIAWSAQFAWSSG